MCYTLRGKLNEDTHGRQDWENKRQALIKTKLKYKKTGKLDKPKMSHKDQKQSIN